MHVTMPGGGGTATQAVMGDAVHAGEKAVQERAGRAFHGKLRDSVPEIATAFLTSQPLIIIAGRAAGEQMWTTMVTGPPGFLQVPDPRTVYVHARVLPSDPLAALVSTGGAVGMIAVDSTHRMRVNGTLIPRPDGFAVHTEQVFANCLKYISERHPTPSREANVEPTITASSALTPEYVAQIRAADMFFIGTSHPDGPADASHRGGNPGFVVVDAPDRLRWPDYVGNSMFMTLGNLTLNPHVGLLFPHWSVGGQLQVSGRAQLNWDPAAAAPLPGAQRVVEMTIDAVRYTSHATNLRWTAPVLSRFNY
jgi:uncharacterized protein